jgi:hypothetical protein
VLAPSRRICTPAEITFSNSRWSANSTRRGRREGYNRREGADEKDKIDEEGPDEKILPDEADARSRELIGLVDIEVGITIFLTSTLTYHND